MTRLHLLTLLLLCAALSLIGADRAWADSAPAGTPVCSSNAYQSDFATNRLAGSDVSPSGTIGFSEPAYTANEDAGQFWVTITRSDTSGEASVVYGVNVGTAESPIDFQRIGPTTAVLPPGQASCEFPVNIVDNGMNGPSVYANMYLATAIGATLAPSPDRERLTILRNDPLATRNPLNPLDLPSTPTDGDPLENAQFYGAPKDQTAAGMAANADARKGDKAAATALTFIAQQPFAYKFEFWNTENHIAEDVSSYLEQAQNQQPGRVVELSTYSLVHAALGSTATPAFAKRYLAWVRAFAEGIGNFRVAMFWEPDSVLQATRLTPAERHIRLVDELKPAIQIFEQDDPHLILYLDAGSSDGMKATRAVDYLRQAGISDAQGFFLNSTHFEWDTTEIQQGQRISKLLGGTHFLISSGVNGRGPLLVKEGAGAVGPKHEHKAEVLCNPAGRGLGTMSTQTGYRGLDGLLWFAPVGNSGGACRPGAPPSPDYWPAYAVSLYVHRHFGVTGPRLPLERDGTYQPYSAAFDG